jgi:hypothetical protein
MSMKNSNYTIGNQTRDLPTGSTVPQPTALPHIHINTLRGQNVELLNVKLVVHIVTTGLWRVKYLLQNKSVNVV